MGGERSLLQDHIELALQQQLLLLERLDLLVRAGLEVGLQVLDLLVQRVVPQVRGSPGSRPSGHSSQPPNKG
jgi:hypothetical protein